MGFTYTKPPLTQGIATGVILALSIGLGALPPVRTAWASVVGSVPEWVLFVVVPTVLHLGLYWSAVALFGHVDRTDRPAFIARYRIQSGKPIRPPMPKVLKNLAANQLFWSPICMVLLYGLVKLQGWEASPSLPSAPRLVLELAGMSACAILWFYASHRFLHRPWWMKRVHKKHHEFRTTAAIASEYAHWVEFTVANFGTLGCGIALLTPSLPGIYVYTLVAISTVLAHHSGYALPWASWSVHHDWHHYRYKECFGTLGIMDRLLGTDPEFRTLKDGDRR